MLPPRVKPLVIKMAYILKIVTIGRKSSEKQHQDSKSTSSLSCIVLKIWPNLL